MRILIAHNQYRHPGGEDAVVSAEAELLRRFGHEVFLYQRSNCEIEAYPVRRKVALLLWDVIWSRESYGQIRELIREKRPDLVHFHNIFYVFTPAVYDACRDEGVPVVQTLHNYRMLCANGVFYRDGKTCEDCRSRGLNSAVVHGCWQNSRLRTLAVARMLKVHDRRGTFRDKVDRYIALSDFSREKFVAAGIPAHKISVKPNFLLQDPGGRQGTGDYALYVGALREYKGVRTLLSAWAREKEIPIKIIGAGPLEPFVRERCRQRKNMTFLGEKGHPEVVDCIKGAAFVVVPSECYENFPRIIVEAFACGVPVVASRLGALAELVREGETGLLFSPGDSRDLAEKAGRLSRDPAMIGRLGGNARRVFERDYSSERNGQLLTDVYRDAIRSCRGGRT